MSIALEILTLAAVSRSVMLICLLLPIAAATGFAFGILYERWHQGSKLERVRKRFEKLCDHVHSLLNQTERACAALDTQLRSNRLPENEQKRLASASERLSLRLQSLTGKATSLKSVVSRALPSAGSSKTPKPPRWITTPVDPRTNLPDKTAYLRNVDLLQNYVPGDGVESGILYVQLDRYLQHCERLGDDVADAFMRQTAEQVLAQLEEPDVLCQTRSDLLIALLPQGGGHIKTVAEAARTAIREGQYLHPHTMEPVFVTASFGYTRVDDNLRNALDMEQAIWHRAQVALQASAKHGRCQLHEVTSAGSSRLIVG
ncbi:diguanylate cyclase domain-containing protein [Rubinisphaera brasiliensis]|uniref:GGDEF domain containing protein n=1 Tax=Rubinisphaera brasiliensis (strain ATCC 49424 / DSM 5305 / JCM 21570 / IAM 15109 / NBRC 103401 / IFAM 1448) TaxID=756272 RepID=F0SFH1_RUBBR|nr:diguanylate cyclase [Rubinisphaera brasiliensis]ADY59378.1 GGDEF domain containing protein [Rubinisphaera brasiliensis DSM 5305]